jgi:magnesium-transporting ATPase (P-type)
MAAGGLFPGDVVVINTADRTPTDACLIEAVVLRAEEAP